MEEKQIIDKIVENVIQGRANMEDEGLTDDLTGTLGVCELVKEAIKEGVNLKEILFSGLNKGMKIVGEKYEKGEYFIPDMLVSAEVVGEAMQILEPYLVQVGIKKKEKFLIATVKGDLHDIGKNLVAIMLKGAGFEVIDLGIDVPAEKILEMVEEKDVRLIGLSALLTTTMQEMENIIKMLKEKGLRDKVKVLIGGAPVSDEFAQKIGADAYCADAIKGVEKANEFVPNNIK